MLRQISQTTRLLGPSLRKSIASISASPTSSNLKNFSSNQPETITYANGGKYVGQLKGGKKNGHGTFTWTNGDSYIGEWKKDKRNGAGTYFYENGDQYIGEWKNNKKHLTINPNQSTNHNPHSNEHQNNLTIPDKVPKTESSWHVERTLHIQKINKQRNYDAILEPLTPNLQQEDPNLLSQMIKNNDIEQAWHVFHDMMETNLLHVAHVHHQHQTQDTAHASTTISQRSNTKIKNVLLQRIRAKEHLIYQEMDVYAAETTMTERALHPTLTCISYQNHIMWVPKDQLTRPNKTSTPLTSHSSSTTTTTTTTTTPVSNPKKQNQKLKHVLKHYSNRRVSACAQMCMGCSSSQDMWQHITVTLPKYQVLPDVNILNAYISSLMIEGNYRKANNVLFFEMEKMNIEPNHHTHATLERSEMQLNEMRTNQLHTLWLQCDLSATRAAWHLFHSLVSSHLATTYHYNVMLKFCNSSLEQKNVIFKLMNQNNVPIDVAAYNLHVMRLRMEGNYEEAQRVVNQDMNILDVTPDAITTRTLQLDENNLSKLRTTKLMYYLQHGGDAATEAAWHLVSKYKSDWRMSSEYMESTCRFSISVSPLYLKHPNKSFF